MAAMPSGDDLFKGRHFDRGIIVLRARWRLRYKLGCRNLVEMMAEPDVSRSYDHHALGPAPCSRIRKAVEPLRASSSRIVARRRDLRQIKGRWTYLCRAVDKAGKTVDFLLRAKRDVAAAKAFFRWAFKNQGRPPRKIALEGYQASRRAAREVLRTARRAAITINGIELMHRLRKGQFAPSKLRTSGKNRARDLERGARPPDPNERQSPITWPFVNLHDNLRRSASLKICDLRCEKGGSADVVAHY